MNKNMNLWKEMVKRQGTPHFPIQESDKSMDSGITTRNDSWYDQSSSNPRTHWERNSHTYTKVYILSKFNFFYSWIYASYI